MYLLRLYTALSVLLCTSLSLKIFEGSLSANYKLFYHRTADFGPSSYNVTGELQAMAPLTGCSIEHYRNDNDSSDTDGAASYDQVYSNQVVLILRGNCTFSLKVFNAQQLGAAGVVVGDHNTSKNDFIVMSKDHDGHTIDIPAVFVPHSTYRWLRQLLHTADDNATAEVVYAMLDANGEYVAPTSTIWLAAFGIVIIVIPTLWCFIVCMALLRKKLIHYVQSSRRRQHLTQIPIILYKGKLPTAADVQAAQQVKKGKGKQKEKQPEDLHAKLVPIEPSPGPALASPEEAQKQDPLQEQEACEGACVAVAGSPTTASSTATGSLVRLLLGPFRERKASCTPHNSSCAICLDDFQMGEELRLLPCEHAYHRHCIDPWLAGESELCPMCKQSIFMRHKQAQGSRHESLLTLCCCHRANRTHGPQHAQEHSMASQAGDIGHADGQVVVLASAQDELVRIDTDSELSRSESEQNLDLDLGQNPIEQRASLDE